MNALTFALVGLVFLFSVPKIYQVYQVSITNLIEKIHNVLFQVPIDRTAKQILDQINQLLAKLVD